MKFSQRLTRAGLTFILLGSVAAVMPNNDTAQATTVNCSGDGKTKYRLSNSLTKDAGSGTVYKNPTGSQSNSITLYTQISRDNGVSFTQVGEPLLILSGTGAKISFSPTANSNNAATTSTTGVAVYPKSTSTTTQSGTVRASFTDGSDPTTYTVDFTVNIS